MHKAALKPGEKERELTMRRISGMASLLAAVGILTLAAALGSAKDQEQVKVVFQHAIPNVQGKSIVAVVVSYPPGGKSLAHHHAPSSFIYAYVLSGRIRSQVGDEPTKIYKVGESFYEEPGSHHAVSQNASDKDPASMLAIFVVDSKDKPLTTPDNK
jgi:quercetin dioxygenase-like cupin family protein